MAITKRSGRTKGLGQQQAQHGDGAGSSKAKVKKATYESTKRKVVGVDDLTLLSTISNEAINDNLQKRFQNGEIYTYIGHVLISINPFRDLGIYTDEILHSYRGKNRLEMSPHVFAIAESAYYNLNAYKENQCVIISGESGAGKTEASKRIMQYIANVSGGRSDSSIQQTKEIILATNPLLESFGCAKTLRNNNSSRHGKYLEMQFNPQGEPVGAVVTNYLLEKGRVVQQIKDERNFHIFYQFTKSAPQKYKDAYGIQGPESYLYTSVSRCYNVPGIDDQADFKQTIQAMNTIGIPENEQDDVFRMLAIILWLGNVQFTTNDEGNAAVTDQGVIDFIAYLMDVNASAVTKALTTRVIEAQRGGRRGSVYDVPLNPVQAAAVRDALAKAIYSNLFDWIFNRVNKALSASSELTGRDGKTMGILDIYGFEIFETNSFEQLCINYVNEKLQQIFIELTLKTEQEEYVREQIKWTPIEYFNNKIVCDLIEEKRPPGIFAALNDAIATAHADPSAADNAFTQRLGVLSSNPHFEARRNQFVVKHYAGDVTYAQTGMTDKNKDQLQKDLVDLVQASGNNFLEGLFPDRIDPDSKKRAPTAGDKIKTSANDLVATLMQCRPSYIRTIKPNSNKSPSEYDTKAVLHQIKYLGLRENVRIRRAGFAYRQDFEKFVERFYLLSPATSFAGEYTWQGDAKSAILQILKDTSIPKEEYQMGVTKAFIKQPETLFALETLRDRYWHNMAIRIQRAWRRFLQFRIECAIRLQRRWRHAKEALQYIRLREEGHGVLGGRKERRRFSLIGYRQFFGDYIGCNSRGGVGEMLRKAANIKEPVEFSARCDILISKLGRSSKPAPRQLLMTKKAIFIMVTTSANRQLTHLVERSIPITQIKYVGLSNLRDDWFALGVGSSQEPDPFITCFFKTEFITRLRHLSPGVDLRFGSTVEYSKKPGKTTTIKFVKDESVPRGDLYKSGTVHVPSGEPPNSVSKPSPNISKAASADGYGRRSQTASRAAAPTRSSATKAAPAPKPSANAARPAPKPANTGAGTTPKPANSTARAPPPPPPPAAAKPKEPLYIGLYDFQGRSESELSFKKDQVFKVMRKEGTDWCLASINGKEGWVPQTYVKEHDPASSGRQAPPPPPAAASKRSSAIPNGTGSHRNLAPPADQANGSNTPDSNRSASNLGNLADALRQRASVSRGHAQDNDEDDDW